MGGDSWGEFMGHVASKGQVPMKRLAGIINPSIVGSVLTVSLLAGCFGIKTYPNTLDKNLHVRTATDSGSLFSSVRTAVDIHRVGPDCATDYEGTVQLNEPSIDIGIPSNRWSRLIFVFASSAFLANSSSTITYETLLKPRAGYNYEITVSYKDDIYNVSVQETHPDNPASREIERRTLRACKVFSARKGAKGSPRRGWNGHRG